MKKQVLLEVKERLDIISNMYICNCLDDLAFFHSKNRDYTRACEQLKEHINSLLQTETDNVRRYGIEGWLMDRGYITNAYRMSSEGKETLLEYRLAFIDHLIEELGE